jgi:hypothetical protein
VRGEGFWLGLHGRVRIRVAAAAAAIAEQLTHVGQHALVIKAAFARQLCQAALRVSPARACMCMYVHVCECM